MKLKIISIYKKILLSLCVSMMLVSSNLFVKQVKAEYTYQELCEAWVHHSGPQRILDLYNMIVSTSSGDLLDIGLALYNYVISPKTNQLINQACSLDPQGDSVHGGHGSYWQNAVNSAQDDNKNGGNKNYYTMPNHTTTSNYRPVVNNSSTTNNISYTFNNQTYNYTTNISNTYYDITNNSYSFYFDNTDYLTYINTYNNTTIIYNGNTDHLYYRLPDGLDSYNMTYEDYLNGYKTSLSVSSYENSYDSADLVFLYHLDQNEYDSAYPSNTILSFSKNSVEYVNDQNFGTALALQGDSDISVNKSDLYYSFRFYPLMDDDLSLSLNGTFIGSSSREYNTITQYNEFYDSNYLRNYTLSTANSTQYHEVYSYLFEIDNDVYLTEIEDKYTYTSNGTQYSNSIYYYSVSDNIEDSVSYFNDYYTYFHVFQDSYDISYSGSKSIYMNTQNIYNPDNIDLSSYITNQYIVGKPYYTSLGGYTYALQSNRSYNYINYDYYMNTGSFNLVNLGMWNFCSVLLDGSVYINGVDTGIDIDNSQDFMISLNGNSTVYFDEFFGNSVNRSYISPSAPYDSNIVYYLPTEFQNNCILIQSLISVNDYKFGGIRPSSPTTGYVYISTDEIGNITSVQQFNGIEWISVKAGLYNEYLDKWINVIGFNIFYNQWDYVDLNYSVEDGNNIIKFLTNKFDALFNYLERLINKDYNNETTIENDISNEYDVDIETSLDTYIDDVFDTNADIDLTEPQFNLAPGSDLSVFQPIVSETIGVFTSNNLGIFIALPIIIGILGLLL